MVPRMERFQLSKVVTVSSTDGPTVHPRVELTGVELPAPYEVRVWVDPVDEVHSERIGLKDREEDRVVDD